MENDPEPARPPSSEYWWREVYYLDFEANKRREDKDFAAYEVDWRSQEAAAWIFELGRRSPAARTGKANLPGYDHWPQFIHLVLPHRLSLTDIVENELGWKSIVRFPPPRGHPPRPGYSESFPGFSFDLTADDAPLKNYFMTWIRSQRKKFQSAATSGVKGVKSHNRRDIPKILDWRFVELLDHKKGQGQPLTDADRTRRSQARKYSEKFRDLIISGIGTADEQMRKVMINMLAAFPGQFGELSPENFDLEKLHEIMPIIEGLMYPTPVDGTLSRGEESEILRDLRSKLAQFLSENNNDPSNEHAG